MIDTFLGDSIDVFELWKIQIVDEDVKDIIPRVLDKFPFVREWPSTWYMSGYNIVFYNPDAKNKTKGYLIAKTIHGDYGIFPAKEADGGNLEPTGKWIATL